MLETFLHILANIGDAAVLIAVTVISAMYLFFCHARFHAYALLCSLLLSGGLIAILKLFFIGCGDGSAFHIESPSGHAALSFAVYGSYGVIVSTHLKTPLRWLVLSCTWVLPSMIAVSRVLMKLHTISEVVLGSFIGIISVALSWFLFIHKPALWGTQAERAHTINTRILLAATLLTILSLQGLRLPAESFIRALAGDLRTNIPACQN